jgi:hypothetical protein
MNTNLTVKLNNNTTFNKESLRNFGDEAYRRAEG